MSFGQRKKPLIRRKKKKVTTLLDLEIGRKIQKIADRSGVSFNDVVSVVLASYLLRFEEEDE